MNKWIFLVLSLGLISVSCKKTAEDTLTGAQLDGAEMAQQIGDAMVSIDESGGSGGGYASMKLNSVVNSEMQMFARVTPGATEKKSLMSLMLPKAEAAACTVMTGWGSCTSNVITRDFGSCTIGTAVVSGTVKLTFDDANDSDNTCALASSGDTISRNPNYTVTLPSGAQLAVTKAGTYGQVITKTNINGLFLMYNDGINRKVTYGGATILDITTTIEAGGTSLVISGTARTNRTLNQGTIVVTDNLAGKSCSLTPSNVTWDSSTCKCASSGSWTGTCSTGTTATVTITGCGTANIDIDGTAEAITFDRCL